MLNGPFGRLLLRAMFVDVLEERADFVLAEVGEALDVPVPGARFLFEAGAILPEGTALDHERLVHAGEEHEVHVRPFGLEHAERSVSENRPYHNMSAAEETDDLADQFHLLLQLTLLPRALTIFHVLDEEGSVLFPLDSCLEQRSDEGEKSDNDRHLESQRTQDNRHRRLLFLVPN